MKKITLYTDGACSGNPGPGGWAAILKYNDTERELCGYDENTTNNRMELTAVIQGLSALKAPCETEVYSDSTYVINSVNKGWLYAWVRKGWRNSKHQEVPNKDLWKLLLPLLNTHKVTFIWVHGHDGNEFNERCDKLAVSQYLNHGKQ